MRLSPPWEVSFSHITEHHRQTNETEEHSLIKQLMAQHLKAVLGRTGEQQAEDLKHRFALPLGTRDTADPEQGQ